MKTVSSQALGLVNRALGLTGAGAALTEFLDGQLDQTLDVAPIVRRGRTQAGTGGLYYGVFENNHAVADTQVSSIAPYRTPVGAIPPYPSPIPPDFDLWLIGAAMVRASGSGTFTGALFLGLGDVPQGWGIDEAGAAVVASTSFPLAFWDSVVGQTVTFGLTEQGEPYVPIGLRMLRPPDQANTLDFSSTSSAAAVFRLFVLLGLFPASLGQDAAV